MGSGKAKGKKIREIKRERGSLRRIVGENMANIVRSWKEKGRPFLFPFLCCFLLFLLLFRLIIFLHSPLLLFTLPLLPSPLLPPSTQQIDRSNPKTIRQIHIPSQPNQTPQQKFVSCPPSTKSMERGIPVLCTNRKKRKRS